VPEDKKDLLKDNRPKRLELIKALEEKRKGRLIVYFTGDRPSIPAMIAEDAIRPFIEHLLKMSSRGRKMERLSLFLYSRGGSTLAPWKIVSKIREFSKSFEVLIPLWAHSAATMICLGADSILIGRNGELGPIDPSIMPEITPDKPWQRSVSVEEVSAYIDFIKNRAGVTDQNALSHMISKLTDELEPTLIGRVNRTFSHIRLVARKLLATRKEKMEEDRIKLITDALTEKMYEHGHAISRNEAKELGLPIENPDTDTEQLMWNLYVEYEKAFELQTPIDPVTLARSSHPTKSPTGEIVLADVPIACVESTEQLDVFRISLAFKPIYESLQANLNINIELNLDQALVNKIQELTKGNQQAFQEMLQLIYAQAKRKAIQAAGKEFKELFKTLTIRGYHRESFNGGWRHES
jgi:hypothetical protein